VVSEKWSDLFGNSQLQQLQDIESLELSGYSVDVLHSLLTSIWAVHFQHYILFEIGLVEFYHE